MSDRRKPPSHDEGKLRYVIGALAAIMFFLLVMPLVALVIRTLTSSAGEPPALFGQPILQAVVLSLGTTAISAVIIALLGTPAAYAFARYNFPFKGVLNLLVELPIVMPPVVAGLALLMGFGRRGLLGAPLMELGITLPFTTAAVIIAQIFVSAPFYIRTVQARFSVIPGEIEEAARMDGASDWQVFTRIILPLSWQAMTVGIILAWARALGEFGATVLFAGNLQGRTQTMPLLVYGALERDINAALWTGLLLIGIAVAALALMRWITKRFGDDESADPLSGR